MSFQIPLADESLMPKIPYDNAMILARKLRSTRANMLGTKDEEHYWDCHDAADALIAMARELDNLRRDIIAAATRSIATELAELDS